MDLPPQASGFFAEEIEELIPAATVVVFRHGPAGGPPELLMLQRAREMRFAGGAAVFPGGRIDPADRELAASLAAPGADHDELAAKVAAVREALEEAGLLLGLDRQVEAAEVARARAELLAEGALAPVLERRGWGLALDSLVPFARWLPRHRRSFDTRFYLHDIGTGAHEVSADATETTRLFWTSAAEALAMADRGEIEIIFPTRRNLERLAGFASFAEAEAHARAVPVVTVTPQLEQRDGEWWIAIREDAGYPVCAMPIAQERFAAAPARRAGQ
ncbi:MAG: NUDIX domain-containing protein [Proteobacteria bacterium]|nr:NUDIX domain-containing protein [Pseudomonadota bacterium]